MLDAHPAPGASARPQLPPVSVPASGGAPADVDGPAALLDAARTLLPVLEAGRPLDAPTLRDAMTRAFGASDADGAWVWKDAYEAAEAAVVLFVQRYGRAMRQRTGAGADGPRKMLAMLAAIAALEPSHTKRSEDQVRLQQFSTPAHPRLCRAPRRRRPSRRHRAGALGRDRHARRDGGVRARLPRRRAPTSERDRKHPRRPACGAVPATAVTRHNAEALADFLPAVRPTVVLMNPPFSATPGIDRIRHDADLRHNPLGLLDAPARRPARRHHSATASPAMPPGATPSHPYAAPRAPSSPWPSTGRAYARRGTGFDTRLTVIERSAEPGPRDRRPRPRRDAGRAARFRHRQGAAAPRHRARARTDRTSRRRRPLPRPRPPPSRR